MSLAAALLMIAQSSAPQIADAPPTNAGPVTFQARASAQILRPVRIDFDSHNKAGSSFTSPRAGEAQRRRDAAGTPWLEFS